MDARMNELQAKFEEVSKKVVDKHFLTVDNILQGPNLPFTKEVMEFDLPPKFKIPQIDPYDRSKDPVDHIETYKAHGSSRNYIWNNVLGLPVHAQGTHEKMVWQPLPGIDWTVR
jgi:hypothetical protein